MSEQQDDGRTLEEMLDNTPEAVAMRKAREARAKHQAQEQTPEAKRSSRRKALVGGLLGAAALARAFARGSRSTGR